jgi:putative Holliday junction resolvase
MAVVALSDMPAALGPRGALFGLDLGEKTIGVAASDPSRAIATPITTLARTKFTADAAKLFALMAEREAGGLVIGLPLNMDGTEGGRCQSTRAFASNLLQLRDLPIAFWDERLSTAAVNRTLIEEGDLSRARRARIVDRAAAAWILQGALDLLRGGEARPTTAF